MDLIVEKVGRILAKQNPRLRATPNPYIRQGSSMSVPRPESIRSPIRFSRPAGADTILSERLHLLNSSRPLSHERQDGNPSASTSEHPLPEAPSSDIGMSSNPVQDKTSPTSTPRFHGSAPSGDQSTMQRKNSEHAVFQQFFNEIRNLGSQFEETRKEMAQTCQQMTASSRKPNIKVHGQFRTPASPRPRNIARNDMMVRTFHSFKL